MWTYVSIKIMDSLAKRKRLNQRIRHDANTYIMALALSEVIFETNHNQGVVNKIKYILVSHAVHCGSTKSLILFMCASKVRLMGHPSFGYTIYLQCGFQISYPKQFLIQRFNRAASPYYCYPSLILTSSTLIFFQNFSNHIPFFISFSYLQPKISREL